MTPAPRPCVCAWARLPGQAGAACRCRSLECRLCLPCGAVFTLLTFSVLLLFFPFYSFFFFKLHRLMRAIFRNLSLFRYFFQTVFIFMYFNIMEKFDKLEILKMLTNPVNFLYNCL